MRGNTITMQLRAGSFACSDSLYQFDYGQRIVFTGVSLPASYEVHFANNEGGKSVTVIGDSTGVDIPDECLLVWGNIHVWIYLHDGEDDGETEYHGVVQVLKRARPTDQEPTPVQQSVIDQTIAALNAGVAEVEGIAEAMPGEISEALAAAKASGEFDGYSPVATVSKSGDTATISITDKEGTTTATVKDGADGEPGDDGYSPTASVSKNGSTATITITDKNGTTTAEVTDGADGEPGDDGYSPTASVSKSGSTATITITDKNGTTTAQVVDGTPVIDDTSTAADKVWSAQKVSGQVTDLNQAISQKYTKPQTGIPASDLASGVIPEVPVQDVQINGSSILSQGVANVPKAGSSSSNLGVVYASYYGGVEIDSNGRVIVSNPTDAIVKAGTETYIPVTIAKQHRSVFYGMAKAAGDTSQASSSNAVGTYTESAKSAISQMLDAPETVSGTTPSITAKPGVRYVCGEVATLSITAPASGCIDVTFTSGSTPTVLTVTTAKTGATLKWANGFDPTSLEANTVYEINILDGEFGVVGKWT